MAMACLRLLTFVPLRPLLSVPFFRFLIARSTYLEALFEYLRAILVVLKQTIMAGVARAVGPMLVTILREALFQNKRLVRLHELSL